jgi:hypothetical protein
MSEKQKIEVTQEEAVMLRRMQKSFRSMPPEKRVKYLRNMRIADPYLKQMLTELLISQGERLEQYGDAARFGKELKPKRKKA